MSIAYTVKDLLALFFCRLGVAGVSPVMPGTCGSFLALLIAPVCFFPLPIEKRILLLGLLFLVGGMASTRAEKLLGKSDPGEVVIDELVGMWLTLLPFADPDWKTALAGFVLFRLFDMIKPWPIRASENWLPAGYGIMLDDVLAGCAAAASLAILKAFAVF